MILVILNCRKGVIRKYSRGIHSDIRKRILSVTYKSQTRMERFRLCTSFMSLQKIKFRPKLEKVNAFVVTKEDLNVAIVTKWTINTE